MNKSAWLKEMRHHQLQRWNGNTQRSRGLKLLYMQGISQEGIEVNYVYEEVAAKIHFCS